VPQQSDSIDYYVQLFYQGDERGLSYIFEKLFPLMVFYSKEIVHDKQLAEDIASMAFVKAWRHHAQLDSFSGIKAYILKIVERDSKTALAGELRRKSLHQSAKPETEASETAFHALVKAETYNNLHQAIKDLAPGMRSIMESIYINGHSITETAKILNINTSTVDTQKKRGIQKLAKILPKLSTIILIFANTLTPF